MQPSAANIAFNLKGSQHRVKTKNLFTLDFKLSHRQSDNKWTARHMAVYACLNDVSQICPADHLCSVFITAHTMMMYFPVASSLGT